MGDEKFEKLTAQQAETQAELEKEREAAIAAENMCFTLEQKQAELEEENNELIDRIEEEEDNNFQVAEAKRAVEQELKETQDEVAALQGKLKDAGGNIGEKEKEIKGKVEELAQKDN